MVGGCRQCRQGNRHDAGRRVAERNQVAEGVLEYLNNSGRDIGLEYEMCHSAKRVEGKIGEISRQVGDVNVGEIISRTDNY